MLDCMATSSKWRHDTLFAMTVSNYDMLEFPSFLNDEHQFFIRKLLYFVDHQ